MNFADRVGEGIEIELSCLELSMKLKTDMNP